MGLIRLGRICLMNPLYILIRKFVLVPLVDKFL